MVWVMTLWSFSKLGQIGMDENTRFKFDTLVDISINSPYQSHRLLYGSGPYIKILQKGAWLWSLTFLVERQALVRLDLCFDLFIYLFFYPGISSEPLNLSQQKFARWRQLVRNRTWWIWIFEFLRGVRLGAKMSLLPGFARSDLHKIQYGAKTEKRYQKSKTVLFWPDNFIT